MRKLFDRNTLAAELGVDKRLIRSGNTVAAMRRKVCDGQLLRQYQQKRQQPGKPDTMAQFEHSHSRVAEELLPRQDSVKECSQQVAAEC